jgi:hypothetical protein
LNSLELHKDNITHDHLLILSWLFLARANSKTKQTKGEAGEGEGKGGKKEKKKKQKKSYKNKKYLVYHE